VSTAVEGSKLVVEVDTVLVVKDFEEAELLEDEEAVLIKEVILSSRSTLNSGATPQPQRIIRHTHPTIDMLAHAKNIVLRLLDREVDLPGIPAFKREVDVICNGC
jgi:hypothetical protein